MLGIEVGEERRDARRAGQQPRDVALGARAVLLLERDVAVGVDERGRLRLRRRRRSRTATFSGTLSSSVSVEPCAEGGAERAVDAAHVVAAGAVAGEAQAEVAQVVGVGRLDEIAFVLDDGDLADVDGVAPGGRARRGG